MGFFHPKTQADFEKWICVCWAKFRSHAQIPAGHIQVLHSVLSSHVRQGLTGTVTGIYSDFLRLACTSGFPPVFCSKPLVCGWSGTWVCILDLRWRPVSVTEYWQQLIVKAFQCMGRLPRGLQLTPPGHLQCTTYRGSKTVAYFAIPFLCSCLALSNCISFNCVFLDS